MSQAIETARTYLRPSKKLPTVWCGGCGLGIVMSAMIRAIARVGCEKNDVAVVSGIGCTGRLPTYVDFNTLHTTHGRALAFATGVKLATPSLTVIAAMGDGDALAIGGNHFIHSCRRNIDMTAIVANNSIYGMTGGQYSPTTPHGKKGTTAPYGNVEHAFDVAALAVGAGATFVARSSVYHARELDRLNKYSSPVDMLRWMKESSVTVGAAEEMAPEELEGKFTRGVITERGLPEVIESYDGLAKRLASDPAAIERVKGIIRTFDETAERLNAKG